jgi:hypothetical protein
LNKSLDVTIRLQSVLAERHRTNHFANDETEIEKLFDHTNIVRTSNPIFAGNLTFSIEERPDAPLVWEIQNPDTLSKLREHRASDEFGRGRTKGTRVKDV